MAEQKLPKYIAEKQYIEKKTELSDYETHTLRALVEKFGEAATIEAEYDRGYYDSIETKLVVTVSHFETDEEHKERIANYLGALEAVKQAEINRKVKAAESEKKLYLKLKKKFEKE